MPKRVLKRIDVLSLAKVSGVLYAVLGFIVVLFMGLLYIPLGMMGGYTNSMAFGVLSLIIFPVLYGLLGFVAGALVAWLYNITAKLVGGVKYETN